MSCGIYKITNKINGHSYIGQSVDIERRWRQHINFPKENSKYPLYQAFVKYGIENFSFEILELCQKEKLDNREIYFITKFNTYCNGYNQTCGGSGSKNCQVKLSNEDIITIYDLLSQSKLSQNEIAKIFAIGPDTVSEINKGKTRQLPGYKYPIRINQHKHFCEKCGIEITKGATLCKSCKDKSIRVALRPNRQELKKMIRELSFLEIGRRYGVSDNTIRKWCVAENLPSKKSEIKKYSDKDWKKL